MAEKIKVGIVSYLNTRPLIYGLRQEPMASQIELWEDTPARLADMLVNGEIDLGLVPVATIPHLPTYQVVGDYCIGTEGEVASVCLFSEVPLEQIETVYLDYQSRSSVALLKWIMQEYWGIKPRLIDAENEDFRAEIKGTSAGLVIGDRAFEQRKISTFIYDLGSEWKKITGLPFVFAAWVSVKPLPEAFIRNFNQANAVGLNALDDILKDIHYDLYDLRKYYTIHVSYPLNEAKRRGMEKFLQVIGG
ncbi:MAG: menaquinone biosynthesis protein [Chitinophagaceae bacterium]|nr:menaquinone biosynthesis protein [Chitinophagaceae bacterium]